MVDNDGPVVKPRQNPKGPKVQVTITIDPELFRWADKHVGSDKAFRSRSHLIERALALFKKQYKGDD